MCLRKISIEFLLGFCLISLVNNVEIEETAEHLAPALGEVVNNITQVKTLLQDMIKNYEKSSTVKKIVNKDEIEEPAAHLDPAFGDIVNNITKVNMLLQDLINNYEKLKKMTKPEPINDTYEDTVIHDFFDDDHEKKRKKSSKPTTPDAITIRIQGTAMEVSEEKIFNTASTKPNKRERNRNNKKEKKRHRAHKDRSSEETDHREVNSKKSTTAKGFPAQFKEIAKKWFSGRLDESQETTEKRHPRTATKNTNLIIDSFSEILQNGTTTTKVKKEKKIDSDIEPRYRHRTDLTIKNHERKERHPIYIKKSSSLLLYQVASTPTYEKKLEPLIPPSDIDSAEESKIIQNEEYKTNVLREAYGDACLKLVVRKCYMACKSVFKEVCRTNHKCSSEFKQSFKKYAITGCDSSFYNNSVGTSGKRLNQDKYPVDLPDMTREGYLSMACGPISSSQAINPPKAVRRKTGHKKQSYVEVIVSGIMKPQYYRQKPHLRSKPPETSTEIKSSKPILRSDKYELACQQASMMKCFKACKYAVTEACKEEKCNEKKKSALDKACKSHCKQSYGGKDSDDESDSEESGSESEEEKKEPQHEWRL